MTLCLTGPGSNGNDGALHIPQISRTNNFIYSQLNDFKCFYVALTIQNFSFAWTQLNG